MGSTEELVRSRHAQITDLRHRLHQIPELGFEEVKTAAAIRAELDRIGIQYTAGVANAATATIAWIGDTNKPCVALRAPFAGSSGFEGVALGASVAG